MIRSVRSRSHTFALFCLFPVVALSTAAAAADDGDRLTTFPVDNRPEGITSGPGSTLLASQILSGKVLSIDALSGETKEIVGEQLDANNARQAWGLWHYNNAIFVGGGGLPFGGGTPQVYVYNASDGSPLATCDPLSTNTEFGSFMNDVTVIGSTAYATDSFNNKLMVFDADEAINNGKCVVSEITLPDVFIPNNADDWGPNGLVEYFDGLLVVDEVGGSVYHIGNLDSGDDAPVYQEVIPAGGAVYGDGLNVLDEKLYITRNIADTIDVYQLSITTSGLGDSRITANFLGNITSPDYHTPATSALYDGYIYSANSYFATLGNISAPANNTVVGVKNMYDEYDKPDKMSSNAPTSSIPQPLSAASASPSSSPKSSSNSPVATPASPGPPTSAASFTPLGAWKFSGVAATATFILACWNGV
mmetsp:Transcript_20604/g.37224  ORF Transcript_20604/g.37224 Transcript_20604/m.37224 type:complete len:420 (-) Transcript_20604:208-1467(-)|eukprot:CAMPEP_0201937000 /NCGR_PEP_ID=MMETSP0903-20130614/38563_1 /ASSEMBLY_ACC=CAM_ASM_000552 /TAXON_ID=420261 /ORGANISM="Thalassiosira antarctica, Strain CCMP982" /LENGTH=419 /DNA_ID=CAMNT_0048477835 /DNA_START=130 /DNA_END=1389 /DNA_ORIENTATION=-